MRCRRPIRKKFLLAWEPHAHLPVRPNSSQAQRYRALFQPPHKLIVVDADNTLWDGIVGEIGPAHVEIGAERCALQSFLRARKEQGMLLALASKNREEDVAEVFRRPEMLLRREDFAAWTINWQPKSRNIASLSKDLALGPSSFIFVDDNPVECADVAANCPAVTTLLLPDDAKQIPDFLRHVWAFDVVTATGADRDRTELYRQQGQRNQFRSDSATFRQFIEGLQLVVSVAALSPSDYDRAAQLTQRTNQFNTTGIRRTVSELSALLESGERRALILRVRDRFGDYGAVGLAMFDVRGDALHVETLLMSCRVLGKGVEHRFVASLGTEASHLGASEVVIPFEPADRNQPAERFLTSIGARRSQDGSFRLSAAEAQSIIFVPENPFDEAARPDETLDETGEDASAFAVRPDFLGIAMGLNSVDRIAKAISQQLRRVRPQLPHQPVPARTSFEAVLARRACTTS